MYALIHKRTEEGAVLSSIGGYEDGASAVKAMLEHANRYCFEGVRCVIRADATPGSYTLYRVSDGFTPIMRYRIFSVAAKTHTHGSLERRLEFHPKDASHWAEFGVGPGEF